MRGVNKVQENVKLFSHNMLCVAKLSLNYFNVNIFRGAVHAPLEIAPVSASVSESVSHKKI